MPAFVFCVSTVAPTWCVKEYHLVGWGAGDAHNPVPGGLSLEGDAAELLAHDGVDQRGLP
jgi:hypothetical protein